MPKHAGGLPAAILAMFAVATGCVDSIAQEPALPPWNNQGTGLEFQLDEGITAATGAADVVGVEGVQLIPEGLGEEENAGIGETEQDLLPVLSADADMSECARDLLRSRLATTVAEDDILAAMALEAELLTLCRERQELVFTLYQVEAALEELRHAGEEDAGEGEADVQVLSLLDQFVEPAAPPIEDVEEEAQPAAEEPPEEEPQPALAWFSILGVKGALRAGITDGQQVWWVTEGTVLPGGVTVATITGSPPKVIVAGDEAATLPWSQRPGGL